ncbi:hypothetical protein CQW23_33443 [Capsicum baccatum]|uniref:Uncharacterized protein n=1 Tax=Capsicum baccatum TaxID=33114 RepID=A0A2G2V1Y1_CAPBA|nr:hypothetical protein CQW23_33443 [Capsicum baccatum]
MHVEQDSGQGEHQMTIFPDMETEKYRFLDRMALQRVLKRKCITSQASVQQDHSHSTATRWKIQMESDFEDIVVDDKTVTLIYASNKYISPNKIGLEAMLLVSPTTTAERSVSPSQKNSRCTSPMVEDYASFSMNVSVERPLVSPTTTLELSTSLSPVEEDNAYFSMNVPVDKPLISLTMITERSITPSPVAEDNAT